MKHALAFLAFAFAAFVVALVWRGQPPAPRIVAEFDARPGRAPVVVVLGGFEGGTMPPDHPLAVALGQAGFALSRVAYFGATGTPAHLDRIALDPLDDHLAALALDARVNARCLYLAGASKGAELALLLASGNPAVGAVAAAAPSHVVFQSARVTPFRWSSWRRGDRPLAFVPYPRALPVLQRFGFGDGPLELHRRALENAAAVADAAIPVERIAGPILLLAAARDQVWPSADMARAMAHRLTDADFDHRVKLSVLEADHDLWAHEPARVEAVTFLTAAAQEAGCLPPVLR